jgi:transposase InsO family protein
MRSGSSGRTARVASARSTALAPGPDPLVVWPGRTGPTFVYTAFVLDAFARRIVGWQVSNSLRSDLALNALEQAISERLGDDDPELKHHSDRGVQYLSIRYPERLALAGIEPPVGSRGDSYDNALAETIIGLYKTELIYPGGPGAASRMSRSPPSCGSGGSTTTA